MWKWCVLFSFLVSAATFFENSIAYLLGLPGLKTAYVQVLSLPNAYNPKKQYLPYKGKHPSSSVRPDDEYFYPINIGEVGPHQSLYSGPLQYPFACMTERSGMGQPLVDNQDGAGIAVYKLDKDGNKTEEVVGYSKDCLASTEASYYYNRVGSRRFYPLSEANNDVGKINVNGEIIDFVVRVERGVINRFIYLIVALRGKDEEISKPNSYYWNKKLIYQFRGGVGVGRRQGKAKAKTVFKKRFDELAKGYAVIYSSGTQTSNHYDMLRAEEVVYRLKKQFVALYDDPEYTVGIGGSGGAVQQYLIAQNHPGLLDAIIPQYSYPDMVTQMGYALDCELLEYYFDRKTNDDFWSSWRNRSLVEGLNAADNFDNTYSVVYRFLHILQGDLPYAPKGSSECVNSWRGPAQVALNPKYVHFFNYFNPELLGQVDWSHWGDLSHVYGVGDNGFANSTWDNVGVQYGLEALKNGKVSPQAFLDLNENVGGWKQQHDMASAHFWRYSSPYSSIFKISPWSEHNMMHVDGKKNPAPRSEGSVEAMNAAYHSGQVFMGDVHIPVLDIRHYLDQKLDMHHSFASLSARLRMQRVKGNADNQVIWVNARSFDPTPTAFDVMDQWMKNIAQHPNKSVAKNKPEAAFDTCFDGNGELIARGNSVWDGEWNGKTPGECMQIYPAYKSSRNVAGEPLAGDVFKCHLQTIDEALSRHIYGVVDMVPYENELKEIFPQGVCDYSKPDVGLPEGLMLSTQQVSAQLTN